MNAVALSNDALSSHVEHAVLGIGKTLADLRPYIEELWTRFDALQPGQAIRGCRTRKEYCESVLLRSPRAVQYMLAGGNPVSSRRSETVSRPESDESEHVQFLDEVPSRRPAITGAFSNFFRHMRYEKAEAAYQDARFRSISEQDQTGLDAAWKRLSEEYYAKAVQEAKPEFEQARSAPVIPYAIKNPAKSIGDLTATLTTLLSELTALNAVTNECKRVGLDATSRQEIETLVNTLGKISRDSADRAERLASVLEKSAA